MMQIEIREYKNIDEEQVKKLITVCSEEYYLISILKSPKLIKAFSAFHKTKLAGVIFAWKSDFHPYCTYFRLLVNPLYKGRNVAEDLFSKLEQQAIDYPLQTSIRETNEDLNLFYNQSGFKILRRTYLPKLAVSNRTKFVKQIDMGNYRFKTLAEIKPDHHLMGKLILLVKEVYEQTHLGNPAAEMSMARWKRLILADDVIANGSLICVNPDHNEIMAYSFLHGSGNKEIAELGWCGAVDYDAISLLPRLVMQQIEYTDKQGYKYIEGEFDTTSPYAMEVLKTIPFPPSAALVTFQKGNTRGWILE